MITLENNMLSFTFPEIAIELSRLAVKEIDLLATRFLAENRATAFATLLNENYYFRFVTEEYKHTATEALLSLTPEAIKKAIQKCVGRAALFDPEARPEAVTTVSFQRTLRIPDDGKTYPLPPSLGDFPLVHVDDFIKTVPPSWNKRGGVMMPMYQAEALWLFFRGKYPCALKVAAGKINAVTGKSWTSELREDPQDYLALPDQPWLDGYCVKKGSIRQFVAMPLGRGYTAEEQLSGEAEHGGIQLQVYPLKASVYFDQFIKSGFPKRLVEILPSLLPVPEMPKLRFGKISACEPVKCCPPPRAGMSPVAAMSMDMGLGAGGMMLQEVYEDDRPLEDYDQDLTSRCFVHLCNSAVWKQITGQKPPHSLITAKEYNERGLPWFDYYRDNWVALEGSTELDALKTVKQVGATKGDHPLADNETLQPTKVIQYGDKRRSNEVREWKEEPKRD